MKSKRLIAFLSGSIFAVLLLESGLRIFASMVSVPESEPEYAELLRRPNRVLILGNSFTAGNGAPAGESYPEQVQRLYDREMPGQVAVFRFAKGAATTGYLLEHFESQLNRYRPTVVVMMTGQPNSWNAYGKDEYLRRTNSSLAARLDPQIWLNRMASYKLVRATFDQYRDMRRVSAPANIRFPGVELDSEMAEHLWTAAIAPSEFRLPMPKEMAVQAANVIERMFRRGANRRIASRYLAMIHHFQFGDPEAALRWVREHRKVSGSVPDFFIRDVLDEMRRDPAAQRNPQLAKLLREEQGNGPKPRPLRILRDWFYHSKLPQGEAPLDFVLSADREAPEVLSTMLWICKDREKVNGPSDAAECFMSFIQKSENAVARHHMWNALIHTGKASGDPTLHTRVGKFVKSESGHLEKLFSTHRPNLNPGADSEADWILSDLREMKKMLAQRSVPLLLQTYPPLRYQDEAYPVDEVIRRFAEEESISLSDTYTFLRLKFAAGEKQAFYPVKNPGDLHLNGRGYGLVADLLRRDLARLGLVQEAVDRDRVTQSGTPH